MAEITPARVVGAVFVGVGVYALVDSLYRMNQPGEDGRTVFEQALDYVPDAIANPIVNSSGCSLVGSLRTPYPVVANNTVIDGPPGNNSLEGIRVLAQEIVGGDGRVAAAFASVETQTGNLTNNCHNCSLFNIHCTSGLGIPGARVGSDIVIAFNNGQPNNVAGFRACLEHFKGFLERRSTDALAALRANNFDGFQAGIARINYATSYTRSLSANGTLSDPFIRRRYERLRTAGLIT